MQTSTFARAALVGALLSACAVGDQDPWDPASLQRIDDDTVGVTLAVPDSWTVRKDPVLFDTHGLFVYAPAGAVATGTEDADGHAVEAVARVALAYQASPDELDALVDAKLAQYAEVSPGRQELTLPGGRRAIAVTGLPGVQPYAVVYTVDDERVYEIGLWSAEGGIDARGRALLDHLELRAPTRSIESLRLVPADQALHVEPPAEVLDASRAAQAERRAAFARAVAADPGLLVAATAELAEPPPELADGRRNAGCGVTAPQGLYWQLQWDGTNTFYSGSWYDLRSRPGWSAMSGNYGSWWGTNFHIWQCSPYYLNQWFANDWPAQYWANAYAAFSGYVEWAGWGTDGFASLGRYVVVRNGQYRSLTAHLTSIASWVRWGAWVDGYNDVIGWAGDTGETYANANWAPHLHARVGYAESLTYNGQPYGGYSVKPRRLRCFACNDFDVAAGGAGGWYTSFWHGRWMRY